MTSSAVVAAAYPPIALPAIISAPRRSRRNRPLPSPAHAAASPPPHRRRTGGGRAATIRSLGIAAAGATYALVAVATRSRSCCGCFCSAAAARGATRTTSAFGVPRGDGREAPTTSWSAAGLSMRRPVRYSSAWSSSSPLFVGVGSQLDFKWPSLLRDVESSPRVCRRRPFHGATAVHLNRFLFDPCELDGDHFDGDGGEGDIDGPAGQQQRRPPRRAVITATLSRDDYRTIHAAKILGLHNGDTVRAGVVDSGDDDDRSGDGDSYCNVAGLVTDDATIEWLPEGKHKKPQPTKNGDPPGSLRVTLASLVPPSFHDDATAVGNDDDSHRADETAAEAPPVSLILALPRPLQLSRILPMISQLGVDRLILTGAKKVPKDYFGSHLFRQPEVLRSHLIEGLAQSGDVRVPRLTVVRSLKKFLEDDLDELFPPGEVARVLAHPRRKDEEGPAMRIRDVDLSSLRSPSSSSSSSVGRSPPRMVVAVGPEGGWEEPYELELLERHGFRRVTLGSRVLRSDVAVVSLLSLAHDACDGASSGVES